MPAPSIGNFLPTNWRTRSELHVNMDGTPPDEVVVTAVGSIDGSDLVPATVVVLAWDSIAHRWTSVFDAAKQSPPSGFVRFPSDAQQPIFPNLNVSNLETATIRGGPQRGSDLFFTARLDAGAGSGGLVAGILHYANQVAQVTWFFQAGTAGTMKVIGKPGAQQVSGTVWDLTPVDSQQSPVRDYHIVFAERNGGWTDISDDRPWIGVAGIAQQINGTDQIVVVSVDPHSPLAGQLLPGDEIIGLDGEPPPANAGALGPAVIDSIAKHLAGDSVRLQVLRNGALRNVPVTLRSVTQGGPDVLLGAEGAASSQPAPGYLGVQIANGANGVAIQGVATGGAADTGGIVAGDTVTAVAGTPVTNVVTFAAAVAANPPGTSVDVAFRDDTGVARHVQVVLGSYPSDTPAPSLYAL